jgi:nucleotide-binding universal stress UspA family protein
MPDTIVVLIDIAHPDSAKALLEKAKSRYAGEDLHIAYVMPYGFYSYVEPFVSEESQIEAAGRAKEAVDELMVQAGCTSATRHVLRGGIGDQALAFAKSIKADIIVVNAIRKGSMLGTLGTHAAQIVRHSECDVHIVR